MFFGRKRFGILLPRFGQAWRFRSGGQRYLLYDTFSTALAAGSVNGTVAEPVGGTRTVTDTNNKISITGGVLSFATGEAANDKVAWPTIARVVGRVFLANISITSTGNFLFTYTGTAADYIQFRGTGNVAYVNNNVGPIDVGAFSATTYNIALIARESGFLYLIKGGAFANWTLLAHAAAGTYATGTPTIQTAVTTSVFTTDNIRVPYQLFIPAPLASDSFNRADSTTVLGSTDGQAYAEANGGSGLAWTAQAGTWGISTNAAYCPTLASGLGIATVSIPTADVIADVNVTRAAGLAGLVLRYVSSATYLYAYHDGTNAALISRVADVEANVVAPTAATYAAGATLRVVLDGTSARLYYNGAQVGTGTTPASTATLHGLYTNNTGPTMDSFIIMARGTGGEYGALSKL